MEGDVARFKSMIIASRVVFAGRRRKCYHAKGHVVSKGDICLEVKEGIGWKGYCQLCAAEMISEGVSLLAGLQSAIAARQQYPGE